MAVMLAARPAAATATGRPHVLQQLKALILLENDPPGWAQQSETRDIFCKFMQGTVISELRLQASVQWTFLFLTRLRLRYALLASCHDELCCNAAAPVPTPALLVGGSDPSPKTDAVGELFVPEQTSHLRHSDGHRPLPKNEADCARVIEQIEEFLMCYCYN